ncbi:MAG: class I SAM-dependent methyltransferase [Sphingomonadales bacterium]|nr:class I SAM-dependent methyltransferase [Sphingomonadales bacterium]
MDTAARLANCGGKYCMIIDFFRSRNVLKKGQSIVIDSSNAPNLNWPVSQACTQAQVAEPAYDYWCSQIAEPPRVHRKQWEFVYILQALARYGMLAPGLKGLGFGVGGEPLASVFAARGVSVLATELEPSRAAEEGWIETSQHAASKQELNSRGLCSQELFDKKVDFRFMDMNFIDDDLNDQFDFCWSACALEHLGSIKNGLDFIVNSLDTLKPGGIAVHTTELNCSSDVETIESGPTVLFRQSDFIALAQRLTADGYELMMNFNLGQQLLDNYVDVPPYTQHKHLKLMFDNWITTSFGLIIRKPLHKISIEAKPS